MKTIYLFALLVFSMAVVFLAGCGGGDSAPYSQVITNTTAFALSGGGTVTTTAANGTAAYTITVSQVQNATGSATLSLSGLPAGVTGAFSQNPVPIAGEPTNVTLTLTIPPTLPDGTYPFTVTSTLGSETHSVGASLVINDSLVVQVSGGGTQTTEPDSSAHFPLLAKLVPPQTLNGKKALHEVTFSVTGLPDGTSAHFTQNPITATEAGVTTDLRVDVDNNFPPVNNALRTAHGKRQDLSFPFTIVATVDGNTFNLPATLIVQVNNSQFDFGITGPQRVVVFTYAADQDGFEGDVDLLSGEAAPVDLTATGLPQGVSATFGPSQVTPTNSGVNFEILFDVSGNAVTGTYPCSVVGTGGGVTRQHPFSLVIYAPDNQP